MAIAVYFAPESMNTGQYDEIIRGLEEAGAGSPAGRLYHVAFGSGDKVQVMDIWDSQESLDAFFGTLMPVLQRLGVDPGQPQTEEVHNIIG